MSLCIMSFNGGHEVTQQQDRAHPQHVANLHAYFVSFHES